MPDLVVDERDGRAHFAVRLSPRASRSAIAAVREGVLHVRVTAAPVNGAANRALVELLGKTLHLGPTAIRIESGTTSPRKRLSVPAEALERLLRL
ncbi:MAG TPA: DUF167 domain-containing protein [Candidatus Limnocylindria bacterium]|nr:DUF167 domain-containing protein [Candidatus Limnocylindria bacterium]